MFVRVRAGIEGGFFCLLHSGLFQNRRLIKSLNAARLAMKSELEFKGDKEILTILLTLMKQLKVFH